MKKIITSISEIGFNNTANIYSVAESAKLGGKLGAKIGERKLQVRWELEED